MNWFWLFAIDVVPPPPAGVVETYGPLAGVIIVTGGFLGYLKIRDAADRIERAAERDERTKAHDKCEETITKVVDRHAAMIKENREDMLGLVKSLGSKEGG